MVPYKHILEKLQYSGINVLCLDWIKDFPKNRSQRVVVYGECSEEAAVTSGVPQGTVLGTIFFLAFTNDMPQHVNSKCRLFTNNSIIYREVKSNADFDQLQQDLDSLHEWETLLGVSLNHAKYHIRAM